jgi:hypothetical protein
MPESDSAGKAQSCLDDHSDTNERAHVSPLQAMHYLHKLVFFHLGDYVTTLCHIHLCSEK